MSTELAACASCGAVTALQTCAGCSVTAYCGKECQRKGWKGHRLECPLLITRSQQQRDVASHKAPPTGLGGYMDALADGRDALTGRQSFTTEEKESHYAGGPYGIIDCGERGRGAAATEPLIPGMLILDEPAVASVPQKQYRDTVCHRCYQLLGKSPRQCKECSCSWWCSDSCQTEARPSHEIECAVLGQFDPKTRESLHGLRFFVQLATCTGNVAIPPKDFVSTKAPATLDGLVATISKVIPKELAVQRSTIQDSIVAVEASGFFITDLDGRRLGSGFFPSAALFNHSCSPNAIVHFDRGRIQIRALRQIATGQELFISYTELYRPVAARREALLAKKNFLCQCIRCVAEAGAGSCDRMEAFSCPAKGCSGYACVDGTAVRCVLCETAHGASVEELEQQARSISVTREHAATLLGQGRYLDCVTTVDAALKSSSNTLDPLHYERFELAVLAVDALALLPELPAARMRPFALAALAAMCAVYGQPPYNPRAIRMLEHLIRIYDSLADRGESQDARQMLRGKATGMATRALQIATTVCGPTSATTQALKRRLAQS